MSDGITLYGKILDELRGLQPGGMLELESEAGRKYVIVLREDFDSVRARNRAAIAWALQNGAYVVDWGSGFQHKGCGCCAYEIEPPAEIDALVREVRREIGALTTSRRESEAST